jgi:hypothetical protein
MKDFLVLKDGWDSYLPLLQRNIEWLLDMEDSEWKERLELANTLAMKNKEIVNDLMGGKFILASDPKFVSLKDQASFYVQFFKESFSYELELKSDFAYLLSYDTAEQLSRDICLFFAILSYELDKDGKNFLELIKIAECEQEKLDSYFENSAYAELIAANNQLKNGESRRDFIRTLARRNILERN